MCFRPPTERSGYLSNSDDTDISHGVVCLELLDIDAALHHVRDAARVGKWLAGLVPPILP